MEATTEQVYLTKVHDNLLVECLACGSESVEIVNNTDGGYTAVCHGCQKGHALTKRQLFFVMPPMLLVQGRRCFGVFYKGKLYDNMSTFHQCTYLDNDECEYIDTLSYLLSMKRTEIESYLGKLILSTRGIDSVKERRVFVSNHWLNPMLTLPK